MEAPMWDSVNSITDPSLILRHAPRLFSVTEFRKIVQNRSLRLRSPVHLRVNNENTVVQARFRSITIYETPVLTYGHALIYTAPRSLKRSSLEKQSNRKEREKDRGWMECNSHPAQPAQGYPLKSITRPMELVFVSWERVRPVKHESYRSRWENLRRPPFSSSPFRDLLRLNLGKNHLERIPHEGWRFLPTVPVFSSYYFMETNLKKREVYLHSFNVQYNE